MDDDREEIISRDSKDHTMDNSCVNGLLVNDADFSDPEEFVDKVSDDGLYQFF